MIVENTKKSLSIKEIEDVEIRLGFKFPVEYKNFLLKYNGGNPKQNEFSFYDTENRLSASLIAYFHAICGDCKNGNLEIEYEYFKSSKRIPPNILPIASDPFGNFICISVFGKDKGKIYFWDHEIEPQDASCENLSLISESFSKFLAILKSRR